MLRGVTRFSSNSLIESFNRVDLLGYSMAEKNPWKYEVTMGPTYRFVHEKCGHKAKKIPMASTTVYHCPNCNDTTSEKSGLVRRHRV